MGSCLRLRAFAYLPNDRFEEDLILNGRDLIKHTKMDAIKKKMQAMKLEKDNAMDRADACEQQAKDANLRAERAEEEVRELQKKMQQLENDLDQTQEKLMNANKNLEEKEKALQNAEGEVAALNRRIQLLERISKGPKRGWPQLHKSWPRLRTPLTNLNVCARCWRTGACQMKREWKPSKTNSKTPDFWLKKLTENMTRLPGNWPWLRLISNALKKEQRPVSPRL